MSRKRISTQTLKKLFALSGNRCAFPGCSHAIVEGHSLIGEVCHIEAANKGGQRYNLSQTDEDRCAFENLILLCASHHRLTNDVDKFPVAAMQEIKKAHELRRAEAPFKAPDGVILKAQEVVAEITCDSVSLNVQATNVNFINTTPKTETPIIEPDFSRIHLGNEFSSPFAVLTLNFSLPLVNKSDAMVKNFGIHIRAPHMVVKSTDEKFSKTVPADGEIMLHSTIPVFPHQETSLWFTLIVRVKYELESKNKFKKLTFDPFGFGVTESLPINLTVYCDDSKPTSHEYIVKSDVYKERLNNYYMRKEERDRVRTHAPSPRMPFKSIDHATESLLRHIDQKGELGRYLIGQGVEDAHGEVALVFASVKEKVEELSKNAPNLNLSVGGVPNHMVARRSAHGACAIDIQWQQSYRKKFENAQLMVSFWKGLRLIPGRSEVRLPELPQIFGNSEQQVSYSAWSLSCEKPAVWNWTGGNKVTHLTSLELAIKLYEDFIALIKANHSS